MAEAARHGWWKAFVEKVPDGYFDLLAIEEDASRIVHFHPMVVPGLLQTEEYAEVVTLTTTLKSLTSAEAAMLVRVRMLRQQGVFHSDRSKQLVFLLDESVLRRPVGTAGTMGRQLQHLLGMAEHPMVSVTVLPFQAQPHPGFLGAFMVLQYGNGLDDVICFETHMGNKLVRNSPDLVREYQTLSQRLASVDPNGERSRQAIASALSDTA